MSEIHLAVCNGPYCDTSLIRLRVLMTDIRKLSIPPSPPLVPVERIQAGTGQRPEQKPNAEETEEAGQKMRHLHDHHTAHVSICPDQQQNIVFYSTALDQAS